MSTIDWKVIGDALDRYLLENRLSVESFATDTGISRRTIDRIRQGKSARLNTLRKIEMRLGHKFLKNDIPASEDRKTTATLGEYTFEDVKDYIGEYFSFRHSFDYEDGIVCAYNKIFWDDNHKALLFHERQSNKDRSGIRHEYEFSGLLGVFDEIGIVQMMVTTTGVKRIINLKSSPSTGKSVMRGVLLTLNEVTDVGFYPVATPIVFFKSTEPSSKRQIDQRIGSFQIDESWHDEAATELARVSSKFLAFSHH